MSWTTAREKSERVGGEVSHVQGRGPRAEGRWCPTGISDPREDSAASTFTVHLAKPLTTWLSFQQKLSVMRAAECLELARDTEVKVSKVGRTEGAGALPAGWRGRRVAWASRRRGPALWGGFLGLLLSEAGSASWRRPLADVSDRENIIFHPRDHERPPRLSTSRRRHSRSSLVTCNGEFLLWEHLARPSVQECQPLWNQRVSLGSSIYPTTIERLPWAKYSAVAWPARENRGYPASKSQLFKYF